MPTNTRLISLANCSPASGKQSTAAYTASTEARDLIYLHSPEHAAAINLYRPHLEGEPKAADEPLEIISAAIDRTTNHLRSAKSVRQMNPTNDVFAITMNPDPIGVVFRTDVKSHCSELISTDFNFRPSSLKGLAKATGWQHESIVISGFAKRAAGKSTPTSVERVRRLVLRHKHGRGHRRSLRQRENRQERSVDLRLCPWY